MRFSVESGYHAVWFPSESLKINEFNSIGGTVFKKIDFRVPLLLDSVNVSGITIGMAAPLASQYSDYDEESSLVGVHWYSWTIINWPISIFLLSLTFVAWVFATFFIIPVLIVLTAVIAVSVMIGMRDALWCFPYYTSSSIKKLLYCLLFVKSRFIVSLANSLVDRACPIVNTIMHTRKGEFFDAMESAYGIEDDSLRSYYVGFVGRSQRLSNINSSVIHSFLA